MVKGEIILKEKELFFLICSNEVAKAYRCAINYNINNLGRQQCLFHFFMKLKMIYCFFSKLGTHRNVCLFWT